MEPTGERPRRETPGRRANDEVLEWRVGAVEKQVEIFAPTASNVGVLTHQIDEHERRIDDAEAGLRDTREEVRKSSTELLAIVNDVKLKVEGMSVRLALIVGLGSLLGGGAVTLVVALITTN